MTTTITAIEPWRFLAAYLLILVAWLIIRHTKTGQTTLILWASLKMTLQLALAGVILTYLITNPHPLLVALYIAVMLAFAIHRIWSQNKDLNKKFKWVAAATLTVTNVAIITFFIIVIVNEDILNPQYAIPLTGIILGNAMTGIMLALKTFKETLSAEKHKIHTLINCGTHPKDILQPIANQATATAMLPTINSMLGMGIIFLPGMMTGQILSGVYPVTAIMYQTAIMLALSAIVTITVYVTLTLGYRTLYNKQAQLNNLE